MTRSYSALCSGVKRRAPEASIQPPLRPSRYQRPSFLWAPQKATLVLASREKPAISGDEREVNSVIGEAISGDECEVNSAIGEAWAGRDHQDIPTRLRADKTPLGKLECGDSASGVRTSPEALTTFCSSAALSPSIVNFSWGRGASERGLCGGCHSLTGGKKLSFAARPEECGAGATHQMFTAAPPGWGRPREDLRPALPAWAKWDLLILELPHLQPSCSHCLASATQRLQASSTTKH